MIQTYAYELWNGKEVIGEVTSRYRFNGKTVFVPTVSAFKEHYNKTYKHIQIPIIVRCVYNDGITITLRSVLDVRRKSKRQIELIKEHFRSL